MSTIKFIKEIKQGRQHDPRKNFEISTIESEIRYDPLTGNSGRICHFSLSAALPGDFEEFVKASQENCPFCPGKVSAVTPRFPKDILPVDRLVHGGATLFPNLFPYDDISAVAVITKQHFLPMSDMPTSAITDGIAVGREFLKSVWPQARQGNQDVYGIMTWNYMPPSGGSQIHPHFQVVATTNPGNAIRRELTAEQTYWDTQHHTYMADLVAREESESERWIGESGAVKWFTPFVPSGLLGDCCAVFPQRANILDLTDEDIADFAQGLRRILKVFAGIGLWGFNLTFFPDCMEASPDRHWLSARLLPRFYLNPNTHVSDVAYLQLQLEERFAMVSPEDTAERLRSGFNGEV